MKKLMLLARSRLRHAAARSAPAPAGSCRGSCACTSCRARSGPGCSRPSRRRRACRAGRRCRRRSSAAAAPRSTAARVPVVEVEVALRADGVGGAVALVADRRRCRTACRPPGCPRGRRCGRSARARSRACQPSPGGQHLVEAARARRIERALDERVSAHRRRPLSSLQVVRSVSAKPRAVLGPRQRGTRRRGRRGSPRLTAQLDRRAARSVVAGSSGCGVLRRGPPACPSRRAARRARPASTCPATQRERARRRRRPPCTKKFTFGDEVALAEPVLAELDEEVVARVAVEVVAQLLVAPVAEAARATRARVAVPGDRVVPAAACPPTIEQSTRPMSE